MKQVCLLLASTALAFGISGCAKNKAPQVDSTPAATPPSSDSVTPDLTGKSFAEVIEIKYNKAELKCELWTQQSTALNITERPDDSFVVDLKSPVEFPLKLTLKAQIPNHDVEVTVLLVSTDLKRRTNVRDVDGTIYELTSSPYVKAVIDHKTVTFNGGPFMTESAGTPREFKEQIKDVILKGSVQEVRAFDSDDVELGAFHDYAHCFLDTEIKPEFTNHFVRKDPK